MELFESPLALLNYLKKERNSGKSIGFVPTMGALHDGHISLIQASIAENDLTVASIFVNPLQFNNKKDLELYPRNLEKDLKMLEKAGCNVVFFPSAEEIYKETPVLKLHFGKLEEVMEGKFRPGHFNGVAIVVSKLFHYVSPDKAYFGQKDLQQVCVIRQLVKDLSFPFTLVSCPILREKDGLAMSSRNTRLSIQNRPIAAKIYEALQLAKKALLAEGIENTQKTVKKFLKQYKELELEYFEIADGETLEPVSNVKEHNQVALCIAVYLDGVRLIDNELITIRNES
jgi:pantoate--beta-alanine ligase